MEKIESESVFIWKLLFHILLTPITFFMVLFGKKEFGDLFQPFKDVYNFLISAKFTFFIIIINIALSIGAFIFLNEKTFSIFLNYPSDLIHMNRWFSFITSGFLHADFSHLLWNMLALFIFGRVVEKHVGSFKACLIYFGALIISGVGNSAISFLMSNADIPSLGASGAIMGIVSAAILLDPFYFTYELMLPLPIMVVGWITIYGDFSGVLTPTNDGVAHFAHIFGYVSTALTMFLTSHEDKNKIKKGFFINIVSLVVIGALYFFVLKRYFDI